MPNSTHRTAGPALCPTCRRPAHPDYRPFCSPRCADVDLGRWLTGAYVIPGPAAEEDDRQNAPEAHDASRPDS
jgi:endogenous inhibitor of DNA gyrase (YacG/DUF329 family)